MKRRHVLHAFALTLVLMCAPAAHALSSVYVGIAGIGMQMNAPLADQLSWGIKGEAGFLNSFGMSTQALLRFDVPSDEIPLYIQLGFGAHIRISDRYGDGDWGPYGSSHRVSPIGSLSFGAKFENYNVILQLLGYPVIGLEFPLR